MYRVISRDLEWHSKNLHNHKPKVFSYRDTWKNYIKPTPEAKDSKSFKPKGKYKCNRNRTKMKYLNN